MGQSASSVNTRVSREHVHRLLLWIPGGSMFRIIVALLAAILSAVISFGQAPAPPALRVGIVGLVHGHVHGFLDQYRHSPAIEIVGIAEPEAQLRSQVAARYGFDSALLFPDLESMIAKTHPQAVL